MRLSYAAVKTDIIPIAKIEPMYKGSSFFRSSRNGDTLHMHGPKRW